MAKMYFLDIGDAIYSRNTDLSKGGNSLFRLFWDVPNDIEAGEYIVKVVASSDKLRHSKYVFLNVY